MTTSSKTYGFQKIEDADVSESLKVVWLKSLTAPQDDMWEAFMNYAQHWEIKFQDQQIGYACINDENCLLQFFLLPNWLQDGISIIQQFIHQQNIQKAMIGTNNPICLSLNMQMQKSVKVHTYLFSDFINIEPNERKEKPRQALSEDLENAIDFCHISMGAPKEWLNGYVGDLIEREELFVFEDIHEIIGTFEVRKSDSNSKVANIGMVVSPKHRRKGLGTYLLGQAKKKAIEWNLEPICSCEKDNMGSLKSIHKNGFRSIYQMLLVEF